MDKEGVDGGEAEVTMDHDPALCGRAWDPLRIVVE